MGVSEIHMKGFTDAERLTNTYNILLPIPTSVTVNTTEMYLLSLERWCAEEIQMYWEGNKLFLRLLKYEELNAPLTATSFCTRNIEKIIQDQDFIEEATRIRDLISECTVEEIEIEDDGLGMFLYVYFNQKGSS